MSAARADAVRRRAALTPGLLRGLIVLAEAGIVFSVGLSIYGIYVWPNDPSMFSKYIAAMAMYVIILTQSFRAAGLYRLNLVVHPQRAWQKIITVCVGVFLVMLTCAFALKISAEFSRVWVVSWLAGTVLLILSFRFTIASAVRRSAMSGAFARKIIIYGADDNGQQLINYIKMLDQPWNHVVGVFDDRQDRVPESFGEYPLLGNIQSLVNFARTQPSDEVLVALPSASRERIMEIVSRLNELPIDVRLVPNMLMLDFLNRPINRQYGVPMINMVNKPVSDWGHVGKRVTDFCIAGAALVLCAPLIILCGALIKVESRGPVLFRQQRQGFQNQDFEVLKFRTMYADQADADAEQLTVRDDPRVTTVGKWLRRFSIDELPQLINVLKGDMSLVGPRPHALKAKAGGKLYADVVDSYAVRMKVKPGITGWAQVNGFRGNTETEDHLVKRVEYDLYYIDNWSVLFDLYIILKTLVIVLKSENSY